MWIIPDSLSVRPRVVSQVCGWLILLSSIATFADEPTEKSESEEAGWNSLFDGRTLHNWKVTDFGGEGEVSVKDGMLVLAQGQPITGVVWTGKPLPRANYELAIEAQRVQGTDFFLGLTFPVKKDHCTLVLGGWGGGVSGLSSLNGADASENETTNFVSFESGRWYQVRVRVTDKQIEAWLDDDQIVDVDITNKEISVRLEMEVCRPLGLATYQTVGAYRNFRLRELPAHPVQGQP